MNEPTKEQIEVLREFLHAAVVPLIEDVLVKKLGQAMSYAKEQLAPPSKPWVSLTDADTASLENIAETHGLSAATVARITETLLKERNT